MKTETVERGRKRWINLSVAQRKFLRAMQGEPRTLDQLQIDLNLTPQRLSMWLRTRKFKRALDVAKRELRVRQELLMELGSFFASHQLSKLIGSEREPTARLACVSMIQVTQKTLSAEALGKRSGGAAEDSRSAAEALADLTPECPRHLDPVEAERMLCELEKGSASA